MLLLAPVALLFSSGIVLSNAEWNQQDKISQSQSLCDAYKVGNEKRFKILATRHRYTKVSRNGLMMLLDDENGFPEDPEFSPLHCASLLGPGEFVRKVIRKGEDVNARDKDGNSPLHLAVYAGNLEVLKTLLAFDDIDANAKDFEYGITPLQVACGLGNHELVHALLSDEDVDVNVRGYLGWTCLHIASFKGHLKIVKALLAIDGVNVNAKDHNGKTPAQIAYYEGNIKIASILTLNYWKRKLNPFNLL